MGPTEADHGIAQHPPGDLPAPPADLATRKLLLVEDAGPWWRIHRCDRDALYFGRGARNRFDAPNAEYGVLYAACDLHGAFIETYGQKLDLRVLTQLELASRCASMVESRAPLSLVELTGRGLATIGADERLCSGSHRVARVWARALWSHPSQPDGILYRARHDPERFSVALFDRADHAIAAQSQGTLLDLGNAIFAVIDHYGFALLRQYREHVNRS